MLFIQHIHVRGAFGKFLVWSFISVTDLQTLSCLVWLKKYLSSMLWHNFYKDFIIQTRKISLWIHVLFVYWKTQKGSYMVWEINIRVCPSLELDNIFLVIVWGMLFIFMVQLSFYAITLLIYDVTYDITTIP